MKRSVPVSKLLYIALFVLVQLAAFAVMLLFFRDRFHYFYLVCELAALAATVCILNSPDNPAYKIAWLIPLLAAPVFGGLLYLLFGRYRRGPALRTQAAVRRLQPEDAPESGTLERLEREAPEAAVRSRYLLRCAGAVPCGHTQTEYLPMGEALYASMLRELEGAEKFIFLEYFIIQPGVMWDGILDILTRKAAEGVDVRVMYDDLGCLMTLPRHYDRCLRERGLRVCVFNPFRTLLSPRFNHRDHRKICVVDGRVGFTGGVNLADEYINAVEKFGRWKDTGVRLEGQAVYGLTTQFLGLWDYAARETDLFSDYAPDPAWAASVPDDGVVQPYTDFPMDENQVGETVYLQTISRAREYVYLTTPYLILDNETVTALTTAARSGVDVRIITPHVPDKKAVLFLTRSYYGPLLQAGVRIFEYTPGFIHAKTMVSDGEYAVVGTINLDYRSLYLHLECAAWMYRSRAVTQVREDFLKTQAVSGEVTEASLGRSSPVRRLWLGVLRAFAPLM